MLHHGLPDPVHGAGAFTTNDLFLNVTILSIPNTLNLLRIRDVVLSYYPAVLMRTFLASWPPALVYLLLQRYLVQGFVAPGLKG